MAPVMAHDAAVVAGARANDCARYPADRCADRPGYGGTRECTGARSDHGAALCCRGSRNERHGNKGGD